MGFLRCCCCAPAKVVEQAEVEDDERPEESLETEVERMNREMKGEKPKVKPKREKRSKSGGSYASVGAEEDHAEAQMEIDAATLEWAARIAAVRSGDPAGAAGPCSTTLACATSFSCTGSGAGPVPSLWRSTK